MSVQSFEIPNSIQNAKHTHAYLYLEKRNQVIKVFHMLGHDTIMSAFRGN